ncbi:MAG: CRISPR-associated protein Cas4, partial [Chthoniobacteraceae bacterium]
MRRKPSGGSRNPRQKSDADGTMDLFKEKMVAALQGSLAVSESGGIGTAAGAEHVTREVAADTPVAREAGDGGSFDDGRKIAVTPAQPERETLPARMLNEFVYCARLFYYEHVEGVFVESADTMRGAAIHQRVDKGSGAMPQSGATAAPVSAEGEASGDSAKAKEKADPETIHSRSVMLGSERFGVVAKMDLVETTVDGDGGVERVCPVDYKAGSPREGEEGNELWDTDRMQLGLQCLVLRENGYSCDGGIIYYRGTKQRVPLDYTPELEAWIVAKIAAARAVSKGPIPPPLVDSPKCVRCSLAPVCLPDETSLLAHAARPDAEFSAQEPDASSETSVEVSASESRSPQQASGKAPRRLMAARDEKRVLFLNTPGYRVGCNDGVIKVKEKDRVIDEVR